MKRVGLQFLVWILTSSLFMLSAACAASFKVGIIDTERIVRESEAAKEARDLLMTEVKEKRALYQEKENEALLLEEALKKAAADGEAGETKKLQDKLAREVKNLKRLKVDLEEELSKQNAELTRQILQEVARIVEEFRKDKSYSLIIERNTVVTFDDSIDITPSILDLYDNMHQ